MTIMPSDLPLKSTGVAEELQDAVADVFPLFESVQGLARLGVKVKFTVAPSEILATITVEPDAVQVLPALLESLDEARPAGSLPTGELIVKGSMCQRTVKLTVLIPFGWVTPAELAVLTGTDAADPSGLL
ncbi:hypothetical protein ACFXC8_13310 [Streptomyces sp. NPDC059441]|uniref:hypothetical protein n=1 Tax=Streptomyces sp. NPDC059441 TaxID=3346829 RepID=UPI0036C04335